MITWLCNANSFEKQWVDYLTSSYKSNVEIIVFNHSVDYITYIRERKDPFVAIHLSDESYSDDYSFYTSPLCKHVFRCYWHPQLAASFPNVSSIGLGYKNGFLDVDRDQRHDRVYNWCFAGNIHNHIRADFIDAFKTTEMEPYYLHAVYDPENVFDSPYGLAICSYKKMLKESKFALCPIGQGNIDSFRVYEALEAGAVPVAVSRTAAQPYDYWSGLFAVSDVPFITAETPQEAYRKVSYFLTDDDEYHRLSQKVHEFWENAKSGWVHQFASCTIQDVLS